MGIQGRIRSTSRIRSFVRIFSVLSLTGFAVALALSTLIFYWVPYEDTGVSLNGDVIDSVPEGSPAAKSGLRVGDRLDPKMSFFDRERIGWPIHPARGQTYRFRVVRDGSVRTITLHAINRSTPSPPNSTELLEYVIGVLSFLPFVAVGTLLVLLRPTPLTWMFFLFCVGNPTSKYFGAVDLLSSLPMPAGFILNVIRTTLLITGYIAFLYFALRFPNTRAGGWRARVERTLPLIFVLYLAFDYHGWFSQFYHQDPGAPQNTPYLFPAISLFCVVVAVASLVGTYRSSSLQDKHRLSWVVAGTVVSYSVVLMREVLASFGLLNGDTLLFCIATQSLSAFAPLGLGYAILRHRVIDVRFVINRAVVYAIMTTLLVVLLASSYWVIGLLLQQTRLAAFAQLAAVIIIGISLQQAYRRIESSVNRWFFKSVHAAQEHLARVAAMLPSTESAQALEATLASEPVTALNLTSGAVFHRRSDGRFERSAAIGWSDDDNASLERDDPLVLHLQAKHSSLSLSETAFPESYLRARTNDADQALPIFQRGVLTAIALYGPHSNGTQIDPSERSSIAKLGASAESAYDTIQARADNAQRLSQLLEAVGNVTYDELHYYLAEQLLAAVPERDRTALIVCAVIPDASDEDVVCATGDASSAQVVQEVASGSALIRRQSNGTYAVHPLIRRVLLRHLGAGRDEMLLRCAAAWKEKLQYGRAFELYWEAGKRELAADQLETHYRNGDFRTLLRTDQYAARCGEFESHEVLHRPRVWLKRAITRLYSEDPRACAREGQIVIEGRDDTLVRCWISWMQASAGELDQARALDVSPNLPSAVSAFAHLVQAQANGRAARFDECEAELKAASDLFVPFDELAAMQSVIRASCIDMSSGRCREAAALLRHATELFDAVQSRMALWSLAELAINAWLAGDDAAARVSAAELRTRVDREHANALEHLALSLSGEFPQPRGIESAHTLAFAFLVQACNAPDAAAARRCAERAGAAAALAHEPLPAVLAAVAQTQCGGAASVETLAEPVQMAESIHSAPLRQAMDSLVLGDGGTTMLTPFLERFEKHNADRRRQVSIHFASCAIMRGTEPLQLSEREMALALAIARRVEPTPAIQLAEMLWPDLDEPAGLRAVQTYVHRVRTRLADHDLIELTAQGYRYRDDVIVDLWDVEKLVRSLPAATLPRVFTLVLTRVSKELNVSRPGYIVAWEWFAPIERRIDELLRTVEYRLAQDALRSGVLDDALNCARSIISRDELDESAWEVVIRCHLAAGDKATAVREFRRYREILQRELKEEPSKELRGIIGTAT